MRKVLVALNSRAGALLRRDPTEVKREVERALGQHGRIIEVVLARGASMARAIDRAVAGDHDAVVVGGGDGSASYAARRLAGTDKVLGVLPLGTLNLLAGDIGMPASLDDALAALNVAVPRRIDLGLLNGRPFHTLSGVGFFSQMARAREETRDIPGKLLRTAAAALRALSRTGRFTLDIVADGRPRQIDSCAVLVTVNCFEAHAWRRECLDAGTLEVHIAEDLGVFARLKAAAGLLAGDWRKNPGIHSFRAQRVSIATWRQRTWVSTDGELMRERVPLRYAVKPRALRLLVPAAPRGTR
jgi:diacylglycerol kinase family enzyme